MLRFKVLTESILLVISLFALTARDTNPAFEPGSSDITLPERHEESMQVQQVNFYGTEELKVLREAIESYFEKAIASGDIVGAGVSIVVGDEVLLADGFGKRNWRTANKVDGQTLFRLGSLSKGFAGILAADLTNEGLISWEDRVSDCLPEFQLGNRTNTGKITFAHLLSHTSGAPYHSYTNLVEAGLPLRDIAGRFKEVQPISEPGTMYSYQNALFALSGEMMKNVTGKDLTANLEDRFFIPLEMCATTMDYETLKKAGNIAEPHVKSRHGWRPRPLSNTYFNAIAAGGINSSATDMARWMQFLLGHRPDVMSGTAIEKAFSPYIKIPGRSKYYQRWPGHISSYYGFGWRIHTFKDGGSNSEKTVWHHGGSVNGYRNEIALFPDSDLGICVLLNSHSRLAQTVIPDLYDIVQELSPIAKTDLARKSSEGIMAQTSGSAGR